MRCQRLVALILVSLLVSWPGGSEARGGNDRSGSVPAPNDSSCPEPGWPHYYYRHPVLFQYTTHTGTLQFIAFGYADACKQAGKGERGGTASTLAELPEEFWTPNALDLMRAMKPVSLQEALPGVAYPGDNVYRWDLPAFPAHGFRYDLFYADVRDRFGRHLCQVRETDVDIVCPGIHPEFANTVLKDVGWTRFEHNGFVRWKYAPDSDSVAAWFLSSISTRPPNPPENFYARHFAADMLDDHGDGGVIRVILHPIDLALQAVPAEVSAGLGGELIIPATIWNQSTRRLLQTEIGWRAGSTGPWQPVEGWRLQGESAWRGPDETIALSPRAGTDVEVRISGLSQGQTVQLMVNHTRAIPEAPLAAGQWGDAYANNITATAVVGAQLDLKVTRIDVPASLTCTEGDAYTARWVIHNSGSSPVTVRRRASVTTGRSGGWSLGERTLTLQPGANEETVSVAIIRCDDLSTVRVEINPEPRAVQEVRYDNNALERQTLLAPASDDADLPTFRTGSGKTIIVPSDCEPNPDATSTQPCLNYPYLRIDL